jgi:DNA-binding CsgD family transcriptional regulator
MIVSRFRDVRSAVGQQDTPDRMVMVIGDTRREIVTGQPYPVGDTVVVADPAAFALLSELFDQLWTGMRPPADHGLTAQQSAALRLLADGYTDEAIAKRLGVSARTVRRIATTLMRRLDARGRFQAGVHAVRAGWLALLTDGSAPAGAPAGAELDAGAVG